MWKGSSGRKTVRGALGSQKHWEVVTESGQETDTGRRPCGDGRQLAAERKGDEDIKEGKLSLWDCIYSTPVPISSEAAPQWGLSRDSVLLWTILKLLEVLFVETCLRFSFCVSRLHNDWVNPLSIFWTLAPRPSPTSPPLPGLPGPVCHVTSQGKTYHQESGWIFAIQNMYKGTQCFRPLDILRTKNMKQNYSQ